MSRTTRDIANIFSPRIKKPPEAKYFYALGQRDSRVIRFAGTLGLISVGFLAVGYLNFLKASLWPTIIFIPVFAIVLLYYLIYYSLLVQYPGFDKYEHQRRVERYKQLALKDHYCPNIAILVPAAGEEKYIVRKTLKAALNLDYPFLYDVFLLDDSKDGMYLEMANQLKAGYLRRPNVGHMQKAGNLNYALDTLEGYQYFLILDADFVPRPEMLDELLPYAAPDVAIVQSPQHFPMGNDVHKRSKIEYGAAYIQQDFYRISQVVRDKFGSAICVGTNALYNVEALKKVGGFEGVGSKRGWGHSEDVHTGLKIIHQTNAQGDRWRIKYIPIQLAEGYCPDTHHSYYKQQNRWCTGSIQLLFSRKTVFSNKLSIAQRIIYGSNALYYFYTLCLLTTPLYLLILLTLGKPRSWHYTMLFLPVMAVHYLINPYLLRKKLQPLAISLVVISNTYTFLQALILVILRKPLKWEATGVTSAKPSSHFSQFKWIVVLFFFILYLPTFTVILLNYRPIFGPSIFVVSAFIYSFTANLAFIYYLLVINGNKHHRLGDIKFYTAMFIMASTVAISFSALKNHEKYQIEFKRDSLISLDKQESLTSPQVTVGDYSSGL